MVIDFAEHAWTALAEQPSDAVGRFDPSTLTDLPEPAQRFLTAALPDGEPLATAVELEMEGRIKLGMWLPFTAHQYLRSGTGLVWAAEVGGRLLRFVGADALVPDGARMQFRLHGRIPIVNASGPDIECSGAGRLAAETAAWLPHALTPQAGATWKPLDDDRATVILATPRGPIDVDITIDDHGHLTDIDLQRWHDSARPPRYEPFGATITSTSDIGGIRIAGAGDVGWDRDSTTRDDAVFFRYRISTARFDTGVD